MPGESVLFHETVLAHAARDPDAVAVESADRSLSYAELAARAHRMALHLRRHGVGPDVPVAIALDRSAESVVAVLGTLLAGGAWVPLDPSYPTERLSYMLTDSGVDLIVAEAHTMDRLPAGRIRRIDPAEAAAESGPAPDPLPPAPTGRHLAYVIYTSGSTGHPKGALLSHAGLANLVRAQADAFGVRPGDRVLQFAPSSFDASVFETAMALATGATLVLADRDASAPGPDLFATLRTRRISHLTLPPSVLATLPDEPLPDLAVLVCAGEALPAALVRRWAPGRRMFNAYGPTEATVWATLAQVRPDDRRPSIGVPVTGVHVAVVDPDGRPVPDGQVGELVIGGAGAARGYHARPGLTAERFVPDPDGPPGARRYRSGDQVCRRPDGTLDFLGRIDHQIKLRGHRIEPDEVAAVLAGHPAVTDAVVVAQGSGDATRLVGYAAGDHDPAGLRAFLADRLPAYLVPDVVVTLDALPLTVSGKIDRSALPEPDRASAGLTGPVTVPRTDTERLLAGFLADLLGHTSAGPDPAPCTDPPAALRLGVHDDIFALGANSLMAGRLAARVRTELGRELPVVVIYRSPTVAAMAAALDDADDTDRAPTPPPLTPADPDAVAPSPCPRSGSGSSTSSTPATGRTTPRPPCGCAGRSTQRRYGPRSTRSSAATTSSVPASSPGRTVPSNTSPPTAPSISRWSTCPRTTSRSAAGGPSRSWPVTYVNPSTWPVHRWPGGHWSGTPTTITPWFTSNTTWSTTAGPSPSSSRSSPPSTPATPPGGNRTCHRRPAATATSRSGSVGGCGARPSTGTCRTGPGNWPAHRTSWRCPWTAPVRWTRASPARRCGSNFPATCARDCAGTAAGTGSPSTPPCSPASPHCWVATPARTT